MRVLVISDVHANLTALEAVLDSAGNFDAVWCLGDLVGYGPDPNQCIERVRNLPNLSVLLGNHDAAALNTINTDTFNLDARLSIRWLLDQLTPESITFLKTLPERIVVGNVTLAHGSPRNPVWEYVLDWRIALANFDFFETDFCFVGHTHIPIIYQRSIQQNTIQVFQPRPEQVLRVEPRAILNPGSVGQPRDRDPRAAYALFDPQEQRWECRRVAYDIHSVQERILAAGLPPRHASRLEDGW